MKLRVLLPYEVLLDAEVTKVTAESAAGAFCLLERHIDFVSSIVPGIVTWVADGHECHAAVDTGVLVKVGLDLRAFVNERRNADGKIGNEVKLGVVLVLVMVAMILLWIVLGFLLGDTSGVSGGG